MKLCLLLHDDGEDKLPSLWNQAPTRETLIIQRSTPKVLNKAELALALLSEDRPKIKSFNVRAVRPTLGL